jgi:hypothetical protein
VNQRFDSEPSFEQGDVVAMFQKNPDRATEYEYNEISSFPYTLEAMLLLNRSQPHPLI